jgi:hypothetical protein
MHSSAWPHPWAVCRLGSEVPYVPVPVGKQVEEKKQLADASAFVCSRT